MTQPFIDSNVVLYLLSSDSAKADRAEQVLEAGGYISVQVLNEVTSVCLRKLKMPWQYVEQVLQAVKAACVVLPLTVETHAKAIEISKRYQLSFYDAHIVASALASGASILLSEDMQSGLQIDSLQILNPFQS